MKHATRFAVLALPLLAACVPAEPLTDYRPVVDPSRTSQAKFDGDLAACKSIATAAEADYAKRQQAEMGANLIAGLILGAAIGSAYGNEYIGQGAAWGAASGAANTDTELAHGGPRRIIDRCMSERGHVVLSDSGRG